MNVPELRLAIETLAFSERGSSELRDRIAHPSAVAVIVGVFDILRVRVPELDATEIEILRHACGHIRTNHWCGLTQAAIKVQALLPATPTVNFGVIDLPVNITDEIGTPEG